VEVHLDSLSISYLIFWLGSFVIICWFWWWKWKGQGFCVMRRRALVLWSGRIRMGWFYALLMSLGRLPLLLVSESMVGVYLPYCVVFICFYCYLCWCHWCWFYWCCWCDYCCWLFADNTFNWEAPSNIKSSFLNCYPLVSSSTCSVISLSPSPIASLSIYQSSPNVESHNKSDLPHCTQSYSYKSPFWI